MNKFDLVIPLSIDKDFMNDLEVICKKHRTPITTDKESGLKVVKFDPYDSLIPPSFLKPRVIRLVGFFMVMDYLGIPRLIVEPKVENGAVLKNLRGEILHQGISGLWAKVADEIDKPSRHLQTIGILYQKIGRLYPSDKDSFEPNVSRFEWFDDGSVYAITVITNDGLPIIKVFDGMTEEVFTGQDILTLVDRVASYLNPDDAEDFESSKPLSFIIPKDFIHLYYLEESSIVFFDEIGVDKIKVVECDDVLEVYKTDGHSWIFSDTIAVKSLGDYLKENLTATNFLEILILDGRVDKTLSQYFPDYKVTDIAYHSHFHQRRVLIHGLEVEITFDLETPNSSTFKVFEDSKLVFEAMSLEYLIEFLEGRG